MKKSQYIYTHKHLFLATFLGGPLATGYLFSHNFKVFGDTKKAKNALIIGFLGVIAITTFLDLLPYQISRHIPNIAVPAAYIGIASGYFKLLQEKKVKSYLTNGIKSANWFKTIVIGVVGALVIVLSTIVGSLLNTNFNYRYYLWNSCQEYGMVNKNIDTKLYVPEDAACFVHNKLGNSGYDLYDIDEVLTLEYEYQNQTGMVLDRKPAVEPEPVTFNPLPYIKEHIKSNLSEKQIQEILDQELEYMKSVGIEVIEPSN